VQDAAAALPARLLGDVRGKRVLDLCAAPGGKTLQLAAAGAHVTAVDKSEARLKRLRENLARTKLRSRGDLRRRTRVQRRAVRRHPARRALHIHRHAAPPPGRRLAPPPDRYPHARRFADRNSSPRAPSC
jgi:16S rRNA C967 or C1407 C5-methylase (RsmB/RsmF family)